MGLALTEKIYLKIWPFSLKHLITNNLNHSNMNKLHSSYFMDYKDLKLGISSNPNDYS